MQQIADFHNHSRFSRACSRELTLENLDKTCRVKGIDIIGTGDFTYPEWFAEIKEGLEETKNGSGLYKLKIAKDDKVKFILTTEVALIYKDKEKCRRLHIVIHAPSLEAVERFNKKLDKDFNIRSDGRPILGMSAVDLMKLCFSIDNKFLIYPAHIWTPWFAVFGSKSGYDTLKDCFGEYTKNIFAYETGLSSDPEMNWMLSSLDNLTLLSNSDAHSLPNLGREANIFDLDEFTYDEIYNAIKNNDPQKIKGTIEFYPEEGMYHYDGHRDCGISYEPTETKKQKGICPVCKKPLIIGVMNRVYELADRKFGYKPKSAREFVKLVELDKIIAEAIGIKSRKAKKVLAEYDKLTMNLGTELDILRNIDIEKIKEVALPEVAEGVKRVREGRLIIKPGFDGEYGVVKIFSEEEKRKQKNLF